MAQRSKKSRKSGSPKIFSGTARGVAKQLRALLPLPRKRHLRKQVPFSVKSTLRVEEIPFGDDPPVGIKSLRRWVDLISSATQISFLRKQGFHYKEIAGLIQLNPPIFDGFRPPPRLYNKGRRLKRDNQSKNCPVPCEYLP